MPLESRPVIPNNYEELHQQYGALVYKLLWNANKVERNFQDLHAYVWFKLIEAELLARFEKKIQSQTPKVLTAIQACDFLGVSWEQWFAAMRSYHEGVPRKNKDGSKKRGPRKRGPWMPTPINIAEFEEQGIQGWSVKKALYAFEDVVEITLGDRRPFRKMGRNVIGGVVLGDSRPEGFLKFPKVKVTKSRFQNYLVVAVLNHYSNFCRTQDRKHKERPVRVAKRDGDKEAPIWESTLVDNKVADADTMVALGEAKKMLSGVLHSCLNGVESCKPVEQHESEVFSFLENGASLMQALRKSDIPPKIRRSVIDTVRPLARDFS